MLNDASVFTVKQTAERTIAAFRDWSLVRKRFYYLDEAFVADVKSEIEKISAMHRCKVITIDMANVDVVPSMFLAVLVSLSTGGLRIELLNASESLTELLEITRLRGSFCPPGQ
jgi:hypothetical protein